MSANDKPTDSTKPAAEKQGGSWLGSIGTGVTNTASGLASTGGSVLGGVVGTAGSAVGTVGRGVGDTLSGASSGLEKTAKGGADTIHKTTGAQAAGEDKVEKK